MHRVFAYFINQFLREKLIFVIALVLASVIAYQIRVYRRNERKRITGKQTIFYLMLLYMLGNSKMFCNPKAC